MKKIIATLTLLAMLIIVACDTSKSSVATLAQPPLESINQKKGEMKETNMQAMPSQYQKKELPSKGTLQPMMESPIKMVADSIK
jgi:uncharacterized protein YxeA